MYFASGRRIRVIKKEEPQPCSSGTKPQGNSSAKDEIGQVWEDLTVRFKAEIQVKRARKGQKRIDFNKDIDILEKYALSHGFSNEELVWIWEAAVNNEARLNCSQRKRMLFAMAPNELVMSSTITKIVYWLNSLDSKKSNSTVLVAVYQLLSLYVEYKLVEPSSISTETVLTRLITTDTENSVIPWKMHLFRSTVTPVCVSDIQTNELKKMMNKEKLKSTQLEDIKTCLMLVNIMQGRSPDNAGRGELKHRQLMYPEGIRELFYKRKRELVSKEERIVHPKSNLIFPEFLPVYRAGQLAVKTPLEQVLDLLETEEGATELAMEPALLSVFSEWLFLVLYHKFNVFAQVHSDDERYEFIFDRCYLISVVLCNGLEVINDWLSDFLSVWNFAVFKDHIFKLATFLSPAEFFGRKSLCNNLKNRFVHSPKVRNEIWELCENRFKSWIRSLKVKESENSLEVVDGLKKMLDFIDDFVTSMVMTGTRSGNVVDVMLAYKLCQFYNELQDLGGEMNDNDDEELKEKLLTISPALISLVVIGQNKDAIELLSSITMKRIQRKGWNAVDKYTKDTLLVLNCLLRSNLIERMATENEIPLNVLEGAIQQFNKFPDQHLRNLAIQWKRSFDRRPANRSLHSKLLPAARNTVTIIDEIHTEFQCD